MIQEVLQALGPNGLLESLVPLKHCECHGPHSDTIEDGIKRDHPTPPAQRRVVYFYNLGIM